MCISCGCGNPDDDHGDARNLTLNDIDQAAIAAGTTRDKVLQNIMGSGGQNQQNNSEQSQANDSSQRFRSAESQYDQPVMQTGYSQEQQQQPGRILEGDDEKVPGQRVQTPGTQSGGAWSQGDDQTNYQSPDRKTPSH
ncbi:MAG TPA: hypothetical protein VNG51_18390 [Ktedonobacteraceae bacterium]|nr:hypothetical protein [Ktedonobacteraceae bacterium]